MSQLDKFEEIYMEQYWNIKLNQWSNYFEDGNYGLSSTDNEIYNIVIEYNNLIKPIDRKSKLACLLMQKDIVDKNPIVSQLRNKLDNWDNYSINISSDLKQDRSKYLLELSLQMRNDVIDLMNMRNKLSRELGFSSYPDLVLNTEELDKNMLIVLLNNYVDRNLPRVINLIKKYNIKWESWFSDLNKITKPLNEFNNIEIIKKFMNKIGLDNLSDKIQINYMKNEITGYASEVAPRDIRIVVTPIKSLSDLTVLFHELGHVISYYFNKEEGLYKILPASYDEGMAVVIEHIAPKLIFGNTVQEMMEDIQILEYTRCAISSLYEFELWDNPERAEELYIKYYSKLGFEIKNSSIWAIDSFRSIDSVYIHNYVIGAVLAEKVFELLLINYSYNYKEWGKWMINNIYYDGRKRIFKEKIEKLKLDLYMKQN